jgi:hypothetical protein
VQRLENMANPLSLQRANRLVCCFFWTLRSSVTLYTKLVRKVARLPYKFASLPFAALTVFLFFLDTCFTFNSLAFRIPLSCADWSRFGWSLVGTPVKCWSWLLSGSNQPASVTSSPNHTVHQIDPSEFSQVDIFNLASWKEWNHRTNSCLTVSSGNHLNRLTNTVTHSIVSS